MSSSETRVWLYGSCVSRDMFEYLPADFTLGDYTARQSLISATTPAVSMPGDPDLASDFQRRMVGGDFASSAATNLVEHASRIDILIVDLVDERLGVVPIGGGRYLTRSQELLNSRLLTRVSKAAEPIMFGSIDHFVLWRLAAATFIGMLEQTGLMKRTLLIESTFAASSDTGAPARRWWDRPARHWNKLYAPYYRVLKEAGIRTHVIGNDAVADSAHKWGPSAYHYVDRAYLGIARTVQNMAAELR